jgi:hypothetical protein
MRLFTILPPLIFALASLIFGIVMFVKIGASQRNLAAELQQIHAGQVLPQTLMVIRKYTYTSKHGTSYCHIIFRIHGQADVNNLVSQPFYDSAHPGDKAVGYSFPDGYIIPQSLSANAADPGLAKWIFLFFGLVMGAVFFIYCCIQFSRPAPAINLATLTEAIRDRANQSSD